MKSCIPINTFFTFIILVALTTACGVNSNGYDIRAEVDTKPLPDPIDTAAILTQGWTTKQAYEFSLNNQKEGIVRFGELIMKLDPQRDKYVFMFRRHVRQIPRNYEGNYKTLQYTFPVQSNYNGNWRSWDRDGDPFQENEYKNGVKHGLERVSFTKSLKQFSMVRSYKNGLLEGNSIIFHKETMKPAWIRSFKQGKFMVR